MPSGFCQKCPSVYSAHKKTGMVTLSPKININTFSFLSGFKPKRQDVQEKDWQNYLKNEQLSDYSELIKLFTPQMRELLLNDRALKPVFMRLLPDKYKGSMEILDFGAAKEFGGVQALKQVLNRLSGFQEKNLKLADALAAKGEIVIGCTDRYSKDTMYYAVANNRQMYFPLEDGTFIGVKGSGQNGGGRQFGHSLKDTRKPFYFNKRKKDGRLEGVLTLGEISFALNAAELLPISVNGSLIQFMGNQGLYALPDGEDNWIDEYDDMGIAFYRVLTPHRLTKLPQLLKTDPALNYLRRSLSQAMDRFGLLPVDMPKGTILSSEQLILLIAKHLGTGEAYKQNNSLFKMVLHAQDINWGGQECDLEEMLWGDEYGENLYADISVAKQDRDFMLYSREGLGVRDIRRKLKIIAELMEHSGKYQSVLFPHPQKVLEIFFKAYFSNLKDSYLSLFVLNDLSQGKYVPTEVIVDLLDKKVFSYLGDKEQIKTLVSKLAFEELEKKNSNKQADLLSVLSDTEERFDIKIPPLLSNVEQSI